LKEIKEGDFCAKGHKIEGDNAQFYSNGSKDRCVRCRACQNAKDRERYKKNMSDPEYRRRRNERQTILRQEKTRYERYEKILTAELAGTTGRYTGLNYLNLNKRAQRAWEPLEEAFDKSQSKCYENPSPYIDYHEDFAPSKHDAYKLCQGCPMLVECARFAAAYKPVVGVWGGEVYENGSVVKTSYR